MSLVRLVWCPTTEKSSNEPKNSTTGTVSQDWRSVPVVAVLWLTQARNSQGLSMTIASNCTLVLHSISRWPKKEMAVKAKLIPPTPSKTTATCRWTKKRKMMKKALRVRTSPGPTLKTIWLRVSQTTCRVEYAALRNCKRPMIGTSRSSLWLLSFANNTAEKATLKWSSPGRIMLRGIVSTSRCWGPAIQLSGNGSNWVQFSAPILIKIRGPQRRKAKKIIRGRRAETS